MSRTTDPLEGFLAVDKPLGVTSFGLVRAIRRISGVQKVGHGGTLDPLATGLMLLFVGRKYTRQAERFLHDDKEYVATLFLGVSTDSYDSEGERLLSSDYLPTEAEVDTVIASFQGWQEQVPPMFSAKKQGGKKLYQLARQGVTVDRPPATVFMEIDKISYCYPYVELRVRCSKGTYIRSLADDMGKRLNCYAHLTALRRTRAGDYRLEGSLDGKRLIDGHVTVEELSSFLRTDIQGMAEEGALAS